jgi:hypothetical protein
VTAIHSELAQPDDELVTEIIARRRRRAPKLTLALVVLVAAAGAFALGALAQKHWGSSSSGGARGGGAGAFAAFGSRAGASGGKAGAAGGFRGFGGTAGGGSAFETGTVTLIKGSTLYVTDASGNTVLVKTTPGSSVTKTVSGTVRSIVPGDTVTVVGTQAANGSYTARSIAIGRASNG